VGVSRSLSSGTAVGLAQPGKHGTACQDCLAPVCCGKIAEAEAAVSVNEKKWLVMHMHVQLKLDELRGPVWPGTCVACC
jgi:hypothetical protein